MPPTEPGLPDLDMRTPDTIALGVSMKSFYSGAKKSIDAMCRFALRIFRPYRSRMREPQPR